MRLAFTLALALTALVTSNVALPQEYPQPGRLFMSPLSHDDGANFTCKVPASRRDLEQATGSFALNGTEDGEMFYLYFENRNRDPEAPILLWTNGGPGGASMYVAASEFGPFTVYNRTKLCWNEKGWDKKYNLLFVDHPIGVGYSQSDSRSDRVLTEDQISENLLSFFKHFFELRTDLRNKDLYLYGISFGGHYVPAVVETVELAKQRDPDLPINIKGIILDAPSASSYAIFQNFPENAFSKNLINAEEKGFLDEIMPSCLTLLDECNAASALNKTELRITCEEAELHCYRITVEAVSRKNNCLNIYNITEPCIPVEEYLDFEVTTLRSIFNDPVHQFTIGVLDRTLYRRFQRSVLYDLLWYNAIDMTSIIAYVLDNTDVRVWVIAGGADLVINPLGVEQGLEHMRWKGTERWKESEKEILVFSGEDVGTVKQYGNLIQTTITESGHGLPRYDIDLASDLLDKFISQSDFCTRSMKGVPNKETASSKKKKKKTKGRKS